MQTPSASPESLRRPSQLARGAPLGPGDLPHPGEGVTWSGGGCARAGPHGRGCSFSPGRALDSTSKGGSSFGGEFAGGQAATAGSAFLCARGRHEHILTAGVRREKGDEKFESQHGEILSQIGRRERDRSRTQSQAAAPSGAGITLVLPHRFRDGLAEEAERC